MKCICINNLKNCWSIQSNRHKEKTRHLLTVNRRILLSAGKKDKHQLDNSLMQRCIMVITTLSSSANGNNAAHTIITQVKQNYYNLVYFTAPYNAFINGKLDYNCVNMRSIKLHTVSVVNILLSVGYISIYLSIHLSNYLFI